MRRWIDHYIHGVDSGIENEPPVTFGDAEATVTRTAAAWPVPGSAPVTLPLDVGKPRTATFTDNGREVVAEDLLQPSGNSSGSAARRGPPWR